MKKEIRELKDGVWQITTLNERWYAKPSQNKETKLPEYAYYPSSTWIAGYYPKGIGFYKWLAQKGWDEAEAIKVAAGDKGSKVHYACDDIDKGIKIEMNAHYPNPTTGQPEELTPEEYECVISFRDWTDKVKPELLANEITSFNEKEGYAGTIDKIYRINGEIWIVDIKTGPNLWPEQELQISSYSHLEVDYQKLGITDEEWANRKLAILQIGYRKNQSGYKFTEIQDKFKLFLNAKDVWANENPEATPKQANYPMSVQSEIRAKEIKQPELPIRAEVKKQLAKKRYARNK